MECHFTTKYGSETPSHAQTMPWEVAGSQTALISRVHCRPDKKKAGTKCYWCSVMQSVGAHPWNVRRDEAFSAEDCAICGLVRTTLQHSHTELAEVSKSAICSSVVLLYNSLASAGFSRLPLVGYTLYFSNLVV